MDGKYSEKQYNALAAHFAKKWEFAQGDLRACRDLLLEALPYLDGSDVPRPILIKIRSEAEKAFGQRYCAA